MIYKYKRVYTTTTLKHPTMCQIITNYIMGCLWIFPKKITNHLGLPHVVSGLGSPLLCSLAISGTSLGKWPSLGGTQSYQLGG